MKLHQRKSQNLNVNTSASENHYFLFERICEVGGKVFIFFIIFFLTSSCHYLIMSRETFPESEFQYLMQEMRRMVKLKFDKLHYRLDRVEEKARRKQNLPSRETELRSSRRHYSTRDSYQDFYSTRRSRPREANSEFESFRDDKRKGKCVSTSASIYSSTKDYLRRGARVSRGSKYSATKDLLQRDDCHLYEESFSYSQQKVSHFDDFYFCNRIEIACEKEKSASEKMKMKKK